MFQLLRTISWRHLRHHALRSTLTFLGIAFGVAVIVAIAVVNRSLVGSFQSTIDQIAGKAVLQVSSGETGVAESLYAAVRDTDGVKDAAAAVEGFLPVVGVTGERLYVYGVDLLSDFTVREHRFVGDGFGFERALDFIAAPDSIALTETLAARLSLSIGAPIVLLTSSGKRTFRVAALMQEEGAAKAFGGNFALMDLPVAQRAFGKEGRLDVIDMTLESGAQPAAVQHALREKLGGAAQVERPAKRGEQIEQLLTSFRVGLFFVSLIALFVGFFLIYNTMSVSVMQRKREIGVLRCLGMRRTEVLRLILAEALMLAAAAALVGCVIGWVLAQAALVAVGETVANLFSLMDLASAGMSWSELGLALLSGITVAGAAALHPAWEAAWVSPLESARQAVWRPFFHPRGAWSVRLGGACLGVAPCLLLLAPRAGGAVAQFSAGVLGMLVFLLAIAFFCPVLVFHGARTAGRLSSRAGRGLPIETRLASDNLSRNPIRSGISVATIVISLAAIFTIATFVSSVRGSLLAWIDQMVTADLIVSSGARTAGPKNVPMREEPFAALAAVPGVKLVDLYRLVRTTYQGKPILVESFSAASSASVRELPMADGDGARALKELGAGAGVVVSESFQSKFGLKRGDTVDLPTPVGARRFPILGVYVDYSSDIGSILIDRSLYKKYWRDELVDAFDLWLDDGADEAAVIGAIKAGLGDRYGLFVSTHRELRRAVVEIMEQSFVVNYAVEIVAIVVAIFSVINTLLAAILDRAREIGVLRAIGAVQAQIRRIVLFEALYMGVLGGVLGLLAGSLMAYHHVVYNTKVLTGWTFQFYYPVGLAVLAVVCSALLCLLAGLLPARRAAAMPIVGAIGYE